MRARSVAANLLWAGTAARAWWRFRSDLRRPLAVQHRLLLRYLQENRETEIGRAYGFQAILRGRKSSGDHACALDLIEAYRQRVPVLRYDDVEPMIGRIASGAPDVLTAQPVRRLVPSSGSTSAAKLIPYTARFQRELARAVDAWIADLFRENPELTGGRAYWSVTPLAAGQPAHAGPVPVGFDSDSAYLGGARQVVVRTILAVPDEIRFVSSPRAFRYATLLFLLRAPDLRLISVWHPSFLERLLESLPAHFDALVRDIERGTFGVHDGSAGCAVLARRLRPDRRRAAQLRRISTPAPAALWPHLSLVSCWADGAAAGHAAALARRLPDVRLQAKGLLATEAVVTIPFAGRFPIAVRSHFFEFVDDTGRARLAHELAIGEEYSVVVTTGAGLYRYRLGDRVRVDGWVSASPSLRFVGRDDRVSDRFGEKVSDGFVAGVLERLFDRTGAPPFAMLAPEVTGTGVAYTLFVDRLGVPPDPGALERELRRNPHYAWCVDLGQLHPARVVTVGPGADRAYVDACVARGQRLGEVKPVRLHCDSGWEAVLTSQ